MNKLVGMFNRVRYSITLFLILFIPRFIFLGRDDWNVDAQRWMIRSDLFVKNLLKWNLAETYQSYHPGVTLMWLSGFSKHLYYTAFEYIAGYSPKLSSGYVYPEQFYQATFFSKLPLVIVISLLLAYSCLLLIKSGIPKSRIIIFALMLSFEPYFLGISRFMHLTGLETALIFASITTAYYATIKYQYKYNFLTGILLGFGFLTKSSALVAIPFIVGLIFTLNLFEKGIRSAISNCFLASISISTTFMLTVFLAFPAMWVDPLTTIQNIFINGVEGKGFVDGPHASILQNKFTYYYEILFVKSLGLTFVLALVSIFAFFIEKDKTTRRLLLTFGLYIVYYFGIMSIPSKEMTRYTTVAFPFFIFLASHTAFLIYEKIRTNKILLTTISVLVIFYYGIVFYIVTPCFSTYHTEFLGGMSGYSKIRKPYNDGEYYLQVGEYLNLIGGRDAYEYAVISKSDNKDVSFRFAFKGTTFTNLPDNLTYIKLFYVVDYDEIYEIPASCKFVRGFGHHWPDDFEFVKLYECQK